jgi:hypothetical protein
VTGSYDPASNTLFWGVGNPGPDWDNAYRPGDNLYTDSTLAIDADTGKIKWHFQHTPNDPYDYDSVAEHVLADVPTAQGTRRLALEADRNGFAYAVDRTDGQFAWGIPTDFNQCMTFAEALHRLHALDDQGLYWFEEPIVFDNYEGCAQLARELKTPLQIGENIYGPRDFYLAVKTQASDFYMPDLNANRRGDGFPQMRRHRRSGGPSAFQSLVSRILCTSSQCL